MKSPMDKLVKLQRRHSGIYCNYFLIHIRAEVEYVLGHIKIRRSNLQEQKSGTRPS